MTAGELKQALLFLNLNNSALARHLSLSEGAVRKWLSGQVSVPADVAAWLRRYVRFFHENPPPRRNQT